MIQCKLGCRSLKQKRKNPPIARPRVVHCHWFILPLLLVTPSLIDRKRWSHKQNHCSASDSVGLTFTRSSRSTLLILTLTTTPSLVKTSLKEILGSRLRGIPKIIEMLLLPAHYCYDRYFLLRQYYERHTFYRKHFWCFSTFRTEYAHIHRILSVAASALLLQSIFPFDTSSYYEQHAFYRKHFWCFSTFRTKNIY